MDIREALGSYLLRVNVISYIIPLIQKVRLAISNSSRQ